MKRMVKLLSLSLTFVFIIVLSAGCGSQKESTSQQTAKTAAVAEQTKGPDYMNLTGFPIAKQQITLKGFGRKEANHGDWDKMLVLQEYEKMTNIKIQWETPGVQGFEDRRNLGLSSGDYPDIYFRGFIKTTDELLYGGQGIFIPLNDLIEKYAPNLKALFAKYPEIRKSITMPDGKIYSLPQINELTALRSEFNWINKKWLEQVGLQMPKTTDDYYNILKAFKEKDPNGNGKNDEIPLAIPVQDPKSAGTIVAKNFYGAFGLGNRGQSAADKFIDLGPDGKVRYLPTDPKFKEMLTFLNKLYKEKLLDTDVFTTTMQQFQAKGDQNIVGSFAYGNVPTNIGSKYSNDYVAMPPLKGPAGDQIWSISKPLVQTTGNYVITNKNKYPEASIRWVDYFFAEEGAKFLRYGIEGKTYNKKPDGSFVWSDDILKNPKGLNQAQAQGQYTPVVGGMTPHLIMDKYEGYFTSPATIEGGKITDPFVPKELWMFTYTKDENDKLISINTDINNYVNEMIIKFITGAEPLSNWDAYVKKLDAMGLKDIIAVQNAALQRWNSNK